MNIKINLIKISLNLTLLPLAASTFQSTQTLVT